MNIIFGKEQAEHLGSNHTVLELDTFRITGQDQRVTAYAVIEIVPLSDMPRLENLKKLHNDLITSYKQQLWNVCIDLVDHLLGAWGGELDSFYTILLERVNQHKESEPNLDWDPALEKSL